MEMDQVEIDLINIPLKDLLDLLEIRKRKIGYINSQLYFFACEERHKEVEIVNKYGLSSIVLTQEILINLRDKKIGLIVDESDDN